MFLIREISFFHGKSSPETDFDHYIVKIENISLGTTTTLSTSVKNSFYDVILTTQNNYKFHIINVNSLGLFSSDSYLEITPNLTPSSPTSLLYTSDEFRKGRGTVSWTKIDDADLDHYEVRDASKDWSTALIVSNTSAIYTLNTSDNYTFEVRAKNLAGFYSSTLSAVVAIKVEPSDVTPFTAVQSAKDKRIINFNWGTVTDLDLNCFIIKKGTTWDTATALSTVTNNATNFSYSESTSGTYTYLIKAVNNQGKESINAKSVEIVLNLTPSKPTPASVPFQTSSKDKSLITLSWGVVADEDLTVYQLYVNGELLVETKETSYQYAINAVGSFIYTVRSKNLAGYTSSFLTLYNGEITLSPSTISSSSFTISQSELDSRTINFNWGAISDTDFSYYEIRKGASWDTASVVVTNLKSNYYQFTVNATNYADYEGSNNYLVKAVNSIGFTLPILLFYQKSWVFNQNQLLQEV